jgi:hypothetical protein
MRAATRYILAGVLAGFAISFLRSVDARRRARYLPARDAAPAESEGEELESAEPILGEHAAPQA